jgi:hypothetical protein
MTTKEVMHIDAIATGLYVAIINVVLTILAGIIAFVMILFMGGDIFGNIAELVTVSVFECIVSTILGFGTGTIISMIYNVIACKRGGIKIKLQD